LIQADRRYHNHWTRQQFILEAAGKLIAFKVLA
jgi:hypothetical protein